MESIGEDSDVAMEVDVNASRQQDHKNSCKFWIRLAYQVFDLLSCVHAITGRLATACAEGWSLYDIIPLESPSPAEYPQHAHEQEQDATLICPPSEEVHSIAT